MATHRANLAQDLEDLRKDIEVELCWLEHDEADPERQLRLRKLLEDVEAYLAHDVRTLPVWVTAQCDYAGAAVVEREWPGSEESFGG